MSKILVIISSLNKKGGAEKVAYSLSQLNSKYNVQYLTFYKSNQSYSPNSRLLCLNEKPSSNPFVHTYKLFSRAKSIRDICRKENIHICISHMEESNLPLMISKLLFRNKSKTVVCVHNNLKIKHSILYRFVMSCIYSSADLIIGVSKQTIEGLFWSNLLRNKFISIYNSVDIKEINNKKIASIDNKEFTDGSFNIITIGRLHEQKQLTDFIKAIKNSPTNAKGFIIGEGPLRQKLQIEISRLNLQKRVFLLGFQDNVYKFLAQSDLFILASQYEGFGIVIVEAMSCGLPIISTDCPFGPKEILDPTNTNRKPSKSVFEAEYGLLVPINDHLSITEAIHRLIKNKSLYEQYKAKSIQRANDFDVAAILKQWQTALGRLC